MCGFLGGYGYGIGLEGRWKDWPWSWPPPRASPRAAKMSESSMSKSSMVEHPDARTRAQWRSSQNLSYRPAIGHHYHHYWQARVRTCPATCFSVCLLGCLCHSYDVPVTPTTPLRPEGSAQRGGGQSSGEAREACPCAGNKHARAKETDVPCDASVQKGNQRTMRFMAWTGVVLTNRHATMMRVRCPHMCASVASMDRGSET